MPNWERMKQLRDFLETVPEKRINMDVLIKIDRDRETVAEALRPECGTVGCIAGYAALLFSEPSIVLRRDHDCNVNSSMFNPWTHGRTALGFDNEEAVHAFYAKWKFAGSEFEDPLLDDITKAEVLAYLDKAIAEKNVMVTL